MEEWEFKVMNESHQNFMQYSYKQFCKERDLEMCEARKEKNNE